MQVFWKDIKLRIQGAYTEDLLAAELGKNQQNTDMLMFEGKIYLP